MPRPPTPKKAKPPKPDFVFPPGGAALAAVPGLRLKPRTGDVPRWWPVDTPGKAAFACNVVGIHWVLKWRAWRMGTNGAKTYIGSEESFAAACALRASASDEKASPGELVVVDNRLCVTRCGHVSCLRTNICVTEFAPEPQKFKKLFALFDNALSILAKMRSEPAWADVKKLKRSQCIRCRDKLAKSRTEGEHNEHAKCIQAIDIVRKTWVQRGGCIQCGCCEELALQGDHIGRSGKEEYDQTLDPDYWSRNGGVAALLEHFLGENTTVQCLCMFCHSLQRSHDVYNGASLDELQIGTKAYQRRKNVIDKKEYVNSYKIAKVMCSDPRCSDPKTGKARLITAKNVHAFHCAHIDEVEKDFTISQMVRSRRPLKTMKAEFDRELPKCNVNCANCHWLYETLPRRKEGRELLDALLARGAPVACEVCE